MSKADGFTREPNATIALTERVGVVRGYPQSSFIQTAPRAGVVTVRPEPLSDPEKTAGVRAALARVAERIVAATGCAWGATNIPGDLRR